MPRVVNATEFVDLASEWPVLDVRSPSEYRQGHIPTAISFPLFDDQQRAEVGIAYKHNGRQAALLKGLEFVGPRMRPMAESALEMTRAHWQSKAAEVGKAQQKRVLVHCWRGGMRSQSVSWLLEQVGLEVTLLEGGYKAFRRYVRERFQDRWRFRVLTGRTGSGKTQILHRLAEQGQQIIDLEGLANHRGSAFGNLGPQPTVEQFENRLCWQLNRLEPNQPVWVEDESRSIGRVAIPAALFDQYRTAPAIALDVPRNQRAHALAELYGDQHREQLESSIREIRKRLGGQHVNAAIRDLHRGNLVACAERLLVYYDKAYDRSQQKNARATTLRLDCGSIDRTQLVDQILKLGIALEQTPVS